MKEKYFMIAFGVLKVSYIFRYTSLNNTVCSRFYKQNFVSEIRYILYVKLFRFCEFLNL